MEITLQGRNIELSDSLKEHVEKKLQKLAKYFRHPLQVQVVLSSQKDRQIVEITVPLNDYILRAEESTDDLYTSLDRVLDKLERQIHKYKTKIIRKARRASVEAKHMPPPSSVEEEDSDGDPRVVKSKRFALKPMDVEEAILQMDLLGHDFFVFSNADTDMVNVVYRRRDNNYGLIEPNV